MGNQKKFQWNRSFEHQKHMLTIWVRKYLQFLPKSFCLYKHMIMQTCWKTLLLLPIVVHPSVDWVFSNYVKLFNNHGLYVFIMADNAKEKGWYNFLLINSLQPNCQLFMHGRFSAVIISINPSLHFSSLYGWTGSMFELHSDSYSQISYDIICDFQQCGILTWIPRRASAASF